MAGLPRPAAAPARKQSMRPPLVRPSSTRPQSAAQNSSRPGRPGAISPAESIASVATTGSKRKERDFEHDEIEETNINVVVRCRGRNEREVRENSGVVLHTEGAKGKSVELSMGPSALSNKTFHFDKVFSQAADQSMIYDDVVTPILDEMLSGFNCTIFAYGQTGTGKTYTMSGDMSSDENGMLSDAAGIIPRTLHALFNKLELDDAESSVKCSFIELYNEELRDLVATDENVKLKIYEDTSKKDYSSTLVQGMEESHIKNAIEGVRLLQRGSHKRQVAATKCNDLSSRSHTIFTVTAYVKRITDTGEEYVSAGKLNLVDLAGSENIQRSGAENKRAAEAGLINRSLLTLGRVINALVERSKHVPYRESKLTRLLQDSLGGRTKTCIIATVSPAKSNLEETISTLDYAFRAKNIRNKPQVNQMINKKTLLKEFTIEIEKLKSELIATRQRNGVYLTNETYEEMTVESESRRILSEEQAEKIEAMEVNLRNKIQELFSMTSSFLGLKKDNEAIRATLDENKTILEQTEFVLETTRQGLAEEEMLRKAHEETERQLNQVGTELISTIGRTVGDLDGLHSKIRRKSDLQSLNRNTWNLSQAQVAGVTSLVESRVEEFKGQQEVLMAKISSRMQSFVQEELEKLSSTQQFLKENVTAFKASETEVSQQTSQAKESMDNVLEEIKTLREEVKSRVGTGLEGLSASAERISAEVISELGAFHTQLHGSYSSLGRDFKNLFEDLVKHINSQKCEADELRRQLTKASEIAMQANSEASSKLDAVLCEERQQAANDRQNLLSQITSLVMTQGETQDARLTQRIGEVQKSVLASMATFDSSKTKYAEGMDSWNEKENQLVEQVLRSRETLKTKLKEDWVTANKHNASLQTVTKSVHQETVRIVDEQMSNIGVQMQALDDFVGRARSQNAQHHDSHATSLQGLSGTVRDSYDNIGSHFALTYERVRSLGDEMTTNTTHLRDALSPLEITLRQPLADLRTNVASTMIQEYIPTGETPQKIQYHYPTQLPQTQNHDTLLSSLRNPQSSHVTVSSPSKQAVFNDATITSGDLLGEMLSPSSTLDAQLTEKSMPFGGLREIDMNISAGLLSSSVAGESGMALVSNAELGTSIFKKSITTTGISGAGKPKLNKKPSVVALEGRENSMVPLFAQSTGREEKPEDGLTRL